MTPTQPTPGLRDFVVHHLTANLPTEAPYVVEAKPAVFRDGAEALLPPEDLDRPWLFLVEADRWLVDGEAKKEERGAHLVREDLETLRPVLVAHVKSGQPGAIAIFALAADAQHAKGLRTNGLRLADRLALERAVFGMDAEGGARHVAVVMSSVEDLAAQTAEAWREAPREG
jgi:hypothetical protein